MSLSSTITIQVKTAYIPEQSKPSANRYVFAYHIVIHNMGTEAVTLLNRYWLITDGNNNSQEVQGDGVVGEQPTIAPGESFDYTSGAILETSTGTMEGHYGMISESGEHFDVPITVFSLIQPGALH